MSSPRAPISVVTTRRTRPERKSRITATRSSRSWSPGRAGRPPFVLKQLVRVIPDLAAVALAAEQVGGAQRCLDMAVDYASERVQFGRVIGSFQSIKHKCADMLVQTESAKSAAYYAGWAASEDNEELRVVAPLAARLGSLALTGTASLL
mgnify:CR=1 FL=1